MQLKKFINNFVTRVFQVASETCMKDKTLTQNNGEEKQSIRLTFIKFYMKQAENSASFLELSGEW